MLSPEEIHRGATAKYGQLDLEFQPWKTFYQDIQQYMWPTGGYHLDDGEPNYKAVVHTGMLSDASERAVRTYGAGYQGGLCSPSREWFKLTLEDKELADYAPNRAWLDEATKILYKIYHSSNFYSACHSGFEEQGVFGTEAMFMIPHETEVVRFFPLTAGEYRIASNHDRKVDTLYRHVWMTAKQMADQFGTKNLSAAVTNSLEHAPFTWYRVMHFVEPRKERESGKIDNLNMPYRSVWLDPTDKSNILKESGFNEFPCVVARAATRGQSQYGFGPGHSVLGSSKLVQEMEKTSLNALHLMIKPPMGIDAAYKGVLNMAPAAMNEVNTADKVGARPLFEVNFPVEMVERKIAVIEERIERAFFSDLFLMITNMQRSGRDPTATEILEHKEEKMLMLGPSVERQAKEKLDPVIEFTFNEAVRQGRIPPAPPSLQDQDLKVEYVSVLAQAQKLSQAQGLRAYLAEVERVAMIDPMSTIKTDLMEYLDQYGDLLGIPSKVIKPQKEVEAEIAQIKEQQAQQAQAEDAIAKSQVAKNLGSASTQDGNALADLKQQYMP